MGQSLDALIECLDRLDARATLPELVDILTETDVRIDEVKQFLGFSPVRYTRNLVRSGPWYNLLVLCWRNGQRSPIHDHKGSSCGMRILQGVAAETIFEVAPNGHIWAVGTQFHPAECVLGSQDTDKHQISNLQAAPGRFGDPAHLLASAAVDGHLFFDGHNSRPGSHVPGVRRSGRHLNETTDAC